MLFHGHRLWLAASGAPAVQNALRFRVLKAKGVQITVKVKWSATRERQMQGR
jgi:hypothetical protein